jgi:hypothetical protein
VLSDELFTTITITITNYLEVLLLDEVTLIRRRITTRTITNHLEVLLLHALIIIITIITLTITITIITGVQVHGARGGPCARALRHAGGHGRAHRHCLLRRWASRLLVITTTTLIILTLTLTIIITLTYH